MTNTEIITAVLESRGWIKIQSPEIYEYEWNCPNGIFRNTPDLLNSLDACREVFEKDAPEGYWSLLHVMTRVIGYNALRNDICLCKATCPQRLEAWLRFKGLWKD